MQKGEKKNIVYKKKRTNIGQRQKDCASSSGGRHTKKKKKEKDFFRPYLTSVGVYYLNKSSLPIIITLLCNSRHITLFNIK